MNRLLKNQLIIFVLILMFVSVGYIFADDVTVQQGYMTIDNGLYVGDSPILSVPATDESNVQIDTGLDVYGNITGEIFSLYDSQENQYLTTWIDQYYNHGLSLMEGTSLLVTGNIETLSSATIKDQLIVGSDYYDPIFTVTPDYYNGSWVSVGTNDYSCNLGVHGDIYTDGAYILYEGGYPIFTMYQNQGDVYMQNLSDCGISIGCATLSPSGGQGVSCAISGNVGIIGDFFVTGKVTAYGGIDPPYILYDQQSRDEIIEKVKKEVPPDKQNGAAMFFNKDTKKIENYIASEGKFYDLEGNLIHELAQVVEPTTKYETVYNLNSITGQVESMLLPVQEKYQIKEGYVMDDKTGKFMNKNTSQVASREEALEIHAAWEGKVYDLQHNFVRNIEKTKSPEIAAVGNNNNSSAQINTADNSTEKQEITVKPASLNK